MTTLGDKERSLSTPDERAEDEGEEEEGATDMDETELAIKQAMQVGGTLPSSLFQLHRPLSVFLHYYFLCCGYFQRPLSITIVVAVTRPSLQNASKKTASRANLLSEGKMPK